MASGRFHPAAVAGSAGIAFADGIFLRYRPVAASSWPAYWWPQPEAQRREVATPASHSACLIQTAQNAISSHAAKILRLNYSLWYDVART